jgi:hypothetical protein
MGRRRDSFYRKSGRWSTLVRTFDRIKDWYYEHIVDRENGDVLKHCEEKLSDHKNHGTAKKQ